MRFLLDTNVLSEIRHPQGNENVKRRVGALESDSLFTSAIVLGELTRGVLRLKEGNRKRELVGWLDRFENEFADRILAFDRETAQVWGRLVARGENAGYRIGVSDGQIAATGIHHGMIVITRNVSDFAVTNAQIWNIWESDAPT